MPLTSAERQKRYRERVEKRVAVYYEVEVLKRQVAALESALNEAREQAGLPRIRLPKTAYKATP